MLEIARLTFVGIYRDRIFQGISAAALLFLAIPAISSLSMRQVTEVAVTLSLSGLSFILLLLTVFLGALSLWRDIEKRYVQSVFPLPLSRMTFLIGKFLGVAAFLFCVGVFLGGVTLVVVKIAAGIYPPQREIAWAAIVVAVAFTILKYVLLVSLTFLVSTVSTSFFLPVFATVALYLMGNASQEVYDFLHSPSGQDMSAFLKAAVSGLYYVLPNFAAFDFNVHAVYSLDLPWAGICLTVGYFAVYTATVLFLATLLFRGREFS